VIQTILDNALAATSQGTIHITLVEDATMVTCTIADTGPGIPIVDTDDIASDLPAWVHYLI
jgi:signal transduction histidine kinase